MTAIGPIAETYPLTEAFSITSIAQVIKSAESYSLDYNVQLLNNPLFSEAFVAIVDALKIAHLETAVNQLQEIAYKYLKNSSKILILNSDHLSILRVLFYAKNLNTTDIASLMLRALEEKLTQALTPITNSDYVNKIFKTYAQVMDIAPDTKISISHGGGARYLKDFMQGENKGYGHEAGLYGIYVSTVKTGRDWAYAYRSPIRYFDTPTVLTAEIAAKYLYMVNPNAYEAVVMPEDVDKLEILNITERNLRLFPFEERKKALEEAIPAPAWKPGGTFSWEYLWNAIKDQYSEERIERFDHCMRQFLGMAR